MTERLYLLRHGIAVDHGTPGIAEDERPLTPKGIERVEQVAEGLRQVGVKPDAILTSPLPRARRTADIVARVIDIEDRLSNADALRPPATAASIRNWLSTRTEGELMLVGHNPNLTELLGLLLGIAADRLPFDLKKGGIAQLSSDGSGDYRLDWLATPRLFRDGRPTTGGRRVNARSSDKPLRWGRRGREDTSPKRQRGNASWRHLKRRNPRLRFGLVRLCGRGVSIHRTCFNVGKIASLALRARKSVASCRRNSATPKSASEGRSALAESLARASGS